MAIFDFVKTPKIRQFHYEYRYYDPKKEEREERMERIKRKREAEERGEIYTEPLKKGVFTSQLSNGKSKPTGSNVKMYITVCIIIALVYWLSR